MHINLSPAIHSIYMIHIRIVSQTNNIIHRSHNIHIFEVINTMSVTPKDALYSKFQFVLFHYAIQLSRHPQYA